MKRLIFHVDVNNAFLSWTAVSLLNEGFSVDIRKIPSIIGGDESKRRGIVLAKSPVAKKYGIVTAETIYSARKKCPTLKIFPGNMLYYKEMSQKFYEYLTRFTPNIEQASIDECYLDMTGTNYLYKDYIKLANEMKDEIKRLYGFTVNVGIANNKLCAKMASDFEKPDKVHTLFNEEIESKLWPLPVSRLFMVGKKSVPRLKELHIDTIEDLAKTDINILKRNFKSHGEYMKQAANGIDHTEVGLGKDADSKSISVSRTLPKDVSDIKQLKSLLLLQAEDVGRQLRKQKFYTNCITVIYKNTNFQSYSHGSKLSNPTNTTADIYQVAVKLLEDSYQGEDIRLLGLRLSDFSETRTTQTSLFEQVKEEIKKDKVQEIMDQINEKYGNGAVLPASLKEKE